MFFLYFGGTSTNQISANQCYRTRSLNPSEIPSGFLLVWWQFFIYVLKMNQQYWPYCRCRSRSGCGQLRSWDHQQTGRQPLNTLGTLMKTGAERVGEMRGEGCRTANTGGVKLVLSRPCSHQGELQTPVEPCALCSSSPKPKPPELPAYPCSPLLRKYWPVLNRKLET